MKIKPSPTSQKIDKELAKLLDDVIGNAHERDLFIRSAIHAENVIDKWIEKKTNLPSKTLIHMWFTYEAKLNVLQDLGDVSEPYLTNLKQIGRIRNVYGHTLDPDENSIKQMIGNMKKTPLQFINIKIINPKKDPKGWFSAVTIGTIIELDASLKYDRPLITEEMLSKAKSKK